MLLLSFKTLTGRRGAQNYHLNSPDNINMIPLFTLYLWEADWGSKEYSWTSLSIPQTPRFQSVSLSLSINFTVSFFTLSFPLSHSLSVHPSIFLDNGCLLILTWKMTGCDYEISVLTLVMLRLSCAVDLTPRCVSAKAPTLASESTLASQAQALPCRLSSDGSCSSAFVGF